MPGFIKCPECGEVDLERRTVCPCGYREGGQSTSSHSEGQRFSREDLRAIARLQKLLIAGMLTLLFGFSLLLFPEPLRSAGSIVILCAQHLLPVALLLMALKLYDILPAIIVMFLTIVFAVGVLFFASGFIVLLAGIFLIAVNGKARQVLQQHGVSVGSFGANTSALDKD